MMCFGLGLSMQIETGLDRVEATLEPFGVRPIDPGETVKGRGLTLLSCLPFLRRCWCRAQSRHNRYGSPAQRRHALDGAAPQPPVVAARHRVTHLDHRLPS